MNNQINKIISSLNKVNQDHNSVQNGFFSTFFFLILVLIEKIYHQNIKTLDHISKQLQVDQKYFAACCIFNFLVSGV